MVEVLLLDDLGVAPLADGYRRDPLEIMDNRYKVRSTILTSQILVAQCHQALGELTLAERHPRSARAQLLRDQPDRESDAKAREVDATQDLRVTFTTCAAGARSSDPHHVDWVIGMPWND